MTLFLFDLHRSSRDSAAVGNDSGADGAVNVSSEDVDSSAGRNLTREQKLPWALEGNTDLSKRLMFIHRFVVSLYEDLAALAAANEKNQLKKIQLLCMQALHDQTKLNEYVSRRRFVAWLGGETKSSAPKAFDRRFEKERTRVFQAESMRPLFDRDFFSYLSAAICEERKRIAYDASLGTAG